jgi:hypothetical protein
MRQIFVALSLPTAVAAIVVAWAGFVAPDDLVQGFADGLRRDLISPFVTLAGFLMTITTFIVLRMKESVYDSDEYIEHYEQVVAMSPAGKLGSLYRPLKGLCVLLLATVVACLLTAVANATVGNFGNRLAFALCTGLASGSLGALASSLYSAYGNFKYWLDMSEKKTLATAKQKRLGVG